jgi:cell division septal protein FtsQ
MRRREERESRGREETLIQEPVGLPTDRDRRYWRRRANRRVRQERRTRTLLRWSGVAAVNLAVLGFLVYSGNRAIRHLTTSPEFALRNIRIEGARPGTADRIRWSLAELEGRNVLELDLRSVTALVKDDPWVLRCTVKRMLPHTLRITVEEREPAVVARVGKRSLVVDRTGTVIADAEPGTARGLPVITGLERLRNEHREGAVRKGVAAVELLRRAAAGWTEALREIDLSRADRIVATPAAGPRVLLDPERADRNLLEYLALEDEIGRRVGAATYIDLRWRDRIAVMPEPGKSRGSW